MAIQVNISLSDIKGVTKGLEALQSNLQKEIDEIMQEIAEKGQDYLDKQYQNALGKDPNILDLNSRIDKTTKGYNIVGFGKDVIYEEFGTGDEGENHPHPVKSEYDLNDYNSGAFILDVGDVGNQQLLDILAQNGITSGKFWRYRKNGVHLTQGVPSGQEMWNTRNYLISEEIPKIIRKKGDDIRGYVIGSIKK